jgi:vancomycin resistance protein YoaR
VQHDPALSSLDGLGTAKPLGALGVSLAPALRFGPRLSRLISRAVLGLAILLLVSAATMYWFRSSYDDRIYPAIHVAGLNLSGKSVSGAQQAIEQRANAFESSRASFTYHDRQWQPTLAELGVSVDTEASLDAARAVGREDDARRRVRSAWKLLRDDKNIPLSVSLDEPTLNRWFDRVDTDLGVAPRDAELRVNDGKVTVVPDVAGTVVDREQMKGLLIASLAGLQAPSGSLATIAREPRVRAADLTPTKQRLEQALAQPVKVQFEQQTWTLDPRDLGGYVVQQIDETKTGAGAVTLSLDRKPLASWLTGLVADRVNREPKDAVVGWNGERVVAVESSVDGAKLKPATLADAVSASFFGDHHGVDIPVAVIKPRVDSNHLDKLGITTRLGVGSSNFDGSDDGRATNIQVGANILNGYLIAPHELFSFNHAIGVITPELGFVESNIIDGERIGRDVGGGICQVSTTVFRAAFEAGLPIEEWNPHRYRLGFYEQDDWPVGLDASILQPEGNPFGGGDFSFRNPTDSWILMESYTDGPRVVVVLYGPDLGYKVDVTGPVLGDTYPPDPDTEIVDENADPGTVEQTEYAQEGLDVSFSRDVYDRDGNLIESREFATHFYPRGNVWKVSPDMKGQSPAADGGSA